MLKQSEFLDKYHIKEDILKENNIDWEELCLIYEDFLNFRNKLSIQASFISDVLRENKKVHTVRSRVKDPEHLIAKLIRKTPDRKEKYGSNFQFTIQNYKDEITDLIGVRAIHIFKEDWINIHEFIHKTWKVIEVKANVREGDSTELFDELKIEIDKRKSGYRSVHYLIELNPTIEKVIAEIQVRTIFEEGYGEIDHLLRYPNNDVPDVLELNLLMLNRVAGASDEMASFINHLKRSWEEIMLNHEKQVAELKQIIEKSNMKENEKVTAITGLEDIKINLDRDLLKSSINISGALKSLESTNITRALKSLESANITGALKSLESTNITGALKSLESTNITGALKSLESANITGALKSLESANITGALKSLESTNITGVLKSQYPSNRTGVSKLLDTNSGKSSHKSNDEGINNE
jgi:ppGpp synthetase/RelA/SpoT-type nucleotidyltranferase